MTPDPPLPVDGLMRRSPVHEIVERLPTPQGDGAGLRVDAGDAEPIVVDGEVRISLVRVYSLVGQEPTLIGQIQATGSSEDPQEWDLQFYLHDVERGYTDDYDQAPRWWRDVASRHAVRHREVARPVA